MSYQSRYLAYCTLTGDKTPEEIMERDEKQWPGGRMTGFILWVNERWGKWYEIAYPEGKPEVLTCKDHENFDKWLRKRVEEVFDAKKKGAEV